MGTTRGIIKELDSTTLRIFRRNGKERVDIAWDGDDLLLYINDKFLKRIGSGDISDELLEELVRRGDLSDSFIVDPNSGEVDLNIDYITVNNYRALEEYPIDTGIAPGILSSANTINIVEGGNTYIYISLATKPVDIVTCSVTSNDETIATVDTAEIIFTTENWGVPQQILVTGESDINTSDDTTTITVAITSTNDTDYDSVTDDIINVTVIDNLNPGLVVSAVNFNMEENTDYSFSLQLASAPTDDVIISISSSDTNILTINENDVSVTFTTENWNIPYIVDITSLEINSVDDVSTTIVLNPSSNDLNYNNLPNKILDVTITKIILPNEIVLSNNIWKTKNEDWTDGGDGIYYPNGNADLVEEFGLLYTAEALQRLLVANPEYRLPTSADMRDLASIAGAWYTDPYVYEIKGETIFSDKYTTWSSNVPVTNSLGLGIVPAGYAEIGTKVTYKYISYEAHLWFNKYNSDDDDYNFVEMDSGLHVISAFSNLRYPVLDVTRENRPNSTPLDKAFSVRLVRDI